MKRNHFSVISSTEDAGADAEFSSYPGGPGTVGSRQDGQWQDVASTGMFHSCISCG